MLIFYFEHTRRLRACASFTYKVSSSLNKHVSWSQLSHFYSYNQHVFSNEPYTFKFQRVVSIPHTTSPRITQSIRKSLCTLPPRIIKGTTPFRKTKYHVSLFVFNLYNSLRLWSNSSIRPLRYHLPYYPPFNHHSLNSLIPKIYHFCGEL